MNLEHTSTPASEEINFLTQKINQETPKFDAADPFAFFIRNERNQIIVACNESVIFGSIYTNQLWIHPDHRKNGLGLKLMAQVHDYDCETGCAMATDATMSFQGAKINAEEKLLKIIE